MRNIILITYDSLRADHCGYMGYHRNTTPNLDEMADEGVAYTNAIAPASRTNPSMAGVMTGEPMVVRDRVSNPDYARRHLSRHGTLAEALSGEGYATGAYNPNAYASRYYGFDRGFDHFEDFLFSTDRYQKLFQQHLSDSSIYATLRNLRNFVRREEAFKTWDSYVNDVEQWVRSQDEPFFLWLFSMDTHFPHLTPRSHREWSSLFDQYYYNWRCNQLIDELDINMSDRERQKIIDIYDDSVAFGDALLGELRERLSDFDPIFVVHGDHGEAFGEDGVYGHFYPELTEQHVHVPLVVYDGETEDRVTDPVAMTELYNSLTGGSVSPLDGSDWVTVSDYDGRTHRNLFATYTESHLSTLNVGPDEDENTSFRRRDTVDSTDETATQAADLFKSLNQRRRAHEQEVLAMRDGASALSNDV